MLGLHASSHRTWCNEALGLRGQELIPGGEIQPDQQLKARLTTLAASSAVALLQVEFVMIAGKSCQPPVRAVVFVT